MEATSIMTDMDCRRITAPEDTVITVNGVLPDRRHVYESQAVLRRDWVTKRVPDPTHYDMKGITRMVSRPVDEDGSVAPARMFTDPQSPALQYALDANDLTLGDLARDDAKNRLQKLALRNHTRMTARWLREYPRTAAPVVASLALDNRLPDHMALACSQVWRTSPRTVGGNIAGLADAYETWQWLQKHEPEHAQEYIMGMRRQLIKANAIDWVGEAPESYLARLRMVVMGDGKED